MELYVGFDPGGKGRFGWAICSPEGERLRILSAGNAEHAQNAFSAVKSQLPSQTTITGAGIDAPLFWVANGVRNSDRLVRDAIKKLGAKSPGGTVQQMNRTGKKSGLFVKVNGGTRVFCPLVIRNHHVKRKGLF